VPYGDHPHHVANLHLPAREGGPWPCVVLVHGGYWRSGWDRTLMTPLGIDLALRGIAAWKFEDVSAAIDHLADVEQIDASRVVTCGHSAGGHLALWLAARHRLAGGVGAEPRVRPVAAVSQAGVADLERGWRENLGDGAVEGLLGPLSEGSELFAAASPAALAPLGVPQLLVHGTEDDVVPISQSRGYAERDPLAELVELDGADHFDVLELDHPGWQAVVEWLPAQLG